MRHRKLLAYLMCGCLFLTACVGGQSTGASSSEPQAETAEEESGVTEEPQAETAAGESDAAEEPQAETAAGESNVAEEAAAQTETAADESAPAAEENAEEPTVTETVEVPAVTETPAAPTLSNMDQLFRTINIAAGCTLGVLELLLIAFQVLSRKKQHKA